MVTTLVAVLSLGLSAPSQAGSTVLPTVGFIVQTSERSSYRPFGAPVPLIVHLDSIGIHARGDVTRDSVATVLLPFGITAVRVVGQNLFIAALDQPSSQVGLAVLARTVAEDASHTIRAAGLAVRPPSADDPAFVTDEFVVRFLPDVTVEQIAAMNATYGVEIVTEIDILGNDYLLNATSAAGSSALDLANLYEQSPLTSFSTPNFLAPNRDAAFFPNDELFPTQWHLDNMSDADIDAPEAWDITTGSPNTLIAVFETNSSFDVDNADIAANLEHAWNFFGCGGDEDFSTTTPSGSPDLNGAGCGGDASVKLAHGSAVAGLAAGNGENTEGIAGVCFECSLMLIRAPVNGAALAKTIEYAMLMGADVMNFSFTRGVIDAPKLAIEKVTADGRDDGTGAKGTIVVWAMNDNNDNYCQEGEYPELSSLPEVIAVAASNDLDTRAWGDTAFGSCLALLAPGFMTGIDANGDTENLEGIATADQTGQPGYNFDEIRIRGCGRGEPDPFMIANGLDYTTCFSGSSAAAPIVSGVVGLMLSLNPDLTRVEVTETLHHTADKIEYFDGCTPALNPANYSPCLVVPESRSDTHGYGRVNAFAALQQVPVPVIVDESERYEIGFRAGLTMMSGANTDYALNVPGAGPRAAPVIYFDWFPNSSSLFDFQLGYSKTWNGGVTSDERHLALALLGAFRIDDFYIGPTFAIQSVQKGMTTSTSWGWGPAVGIRHLIGTKLALRGEILYRHWSTTPSDEWGLGLGLGVRLP